MINTETERQRETEKAGEREIGMDQYKNRDTEGDRKRERVRENEREGGKDQYTILQTERHISQYFYTIHRTLSGMKNRTVGPP